MKVLKYILPYLLALLAGLLISLGWITPCPTLVMLVAIVPLLFAEDIITKDERKVKLLRTALVGFIYMYLLDVMLISPISLLFGGWAYLFFCINSLLFAIVFLLYALFKRKLGKAWGLVAFVALYITFEYLLLNLDFSFPVVLLGNALMGIESFGLPFIQWYEYTGVLGGSLWVLAVNVLIYVLISNRVAKKKLNVAVLSSAIVIIVLPIALSVLIYNTYKECMSPVNFVLVQPNIDPYEEKFSIEQGEQLDRMLSLTRGAADESTDFIVFPETALDSNFWYNNINENGKICYLRDSIMSKYTQAHLITGATMLQYFMTKEPPSRDAMQAGDNLYIQMYNAAFQIAKNEPVQIYKKDKLVLGTERNPFAKEWDSKMTGGQTSNLAKAEEQAIFKSAKANVGTFICYEAIFGKYCSHFADMGADILCTITNDGWWLDTDLPTKHLRFVQLRAIENRRSIARCGNTGITAGIDQCGRIVAQSPWWEPDALKVTLNKNKTKTLYSMAGDYIGVMAAIASFFIFWIVVIRLILKK